MEAVWRPWGAVEVCGVVADDVGGSAGRAASS